MKQSKMCICTVISGTRAARPGGGRALPVRGNRVFPFPTLSCWKGADSDATRVQGHADVSPPLRHRGRSGLGQG